MIKTIIFDNNGVLTTSDQEATLRNVSGFLDIKASELKPFWECHPSPLDLGEITNEEFMVNILRKLKKTANIEKLMSVYLNSYQGKKDVQEYALSLKKDYELAMITNFGEAFHRCTTRWGLDKIFDNEKVFLSSDLHMEKPNEDIYLYALNRLNRIPGECIFVDDRMPNVKVANILGMNGILFENIEKLTKDIENIIGYNYAK